MSARRIAIVDGGSFSLPYDHALALALARRGWRVALFASTTRYNPAFLDDLRGREGIEVIERRVSQTAAASRWRGLLAYAALLLAVLRRRREFAWINLQWSVFAPLDLAFAALLGRRLAFTVHNAVPHGFAGMRHRATARLAARAGRLLFPSEATRADFLRRYGASHGARARLVAHGTLPLAPGLAPRAHRAVGRVRTLVFWSTVKPYKGVELFAALAAAPEVAARRLALEVHGAWDASLAGLRAQLVQAGVRIDDRFLDADALARLFARDGLVFVLPHSRASQSGAFYTLLHHGCTMLCADSGDLGDVLRRHGLEALLLDDRTPRAVLAALDRLEAHDEAVATALAQAQAAHAWEAIDLDAYDNPR